MSDLPNVGRSLYVGGIVKAVPSTISAMQCRRYIVVDDVTYLVVITKEFKMSEVI